ncbi:MAG TPA: EamA family transporter, partial [Gammaproteobacteria bacterium]|nr:EamA family transporter [Gammaproteobacteria bacterium]
LDTAGQVAFKLTAINAGPATADLVWASRVLTGYWVYLAIAAYIGTYFVWITLLKHAPVGPAFAATHLDVVAVLFISTIWFGETLSLRQILGAVMIVSGITVLAFGRENSK